METGAGGVSEDPHNEMRYPSKSKEREDAIAEDGMYMRRQRSVALGALRELGVLDARRLISGVQTSIVPLKCVLKG